MLHCYLIPFAYTVYWLLKDVTKEDVKYFFFQRVDQDNDNFKLL